ncbi:hypothetical protein XELAEV_18022427mg, partial [Xenopus laevis]
EAKEFYELNLNRDSLVLQTKAEVRITRFHESRSHHRYRMYSTRSSKSLQSGSSIFRQQLIQACADAEVTKVQAVFVQRKAEMEAEAARMEAEAAQKKAEMEQCEHATALARSHVLEQEANESEINCSSPTDIKGFKCITNYVTNDTRSHSAASNARGPLDVSPKHQLLVNMAASLDQVHQATALQKAMSTIMEIPDHLPYNGNNQLLQIYHTPPQLQPNTS